MRDSCAMPFRSSCKGYCRCRAGRPPDGSQTGDSVAGGRRVCPPPPRSVRMWQGSGLFHNLSLPQDIDSMPADAIPLRLCHSRECQQARQICHICVQSQQAGELKTKDYAVGHTRFTEGVGYDSVSERQKGMFDFLDILRCSHLLCFQMCGLCKNICVEDAKIVIVGGCSKYFINL